MCIHISKINRVHYQMKSSAFNSMASTVTDSLSATCAFQKHDRDSLSVCNMHSKQSMQLLSMSAVGGAFNSMICNMDRFFERYRCLCRVVR